MGEIILDGKEMKTKEIAHIYMQEKLNITQYCGKNLDALWDGLTSYDRPLKVGLINKKILIENLGEYGEAIINTFRDAIGENGNINFYAVY